MDSQFMKLKTFSIILTASLLAEWALADWPQWRGPNRNGISSEKIELPVLSEANPPGEAWTFSPVPSDHDGGHGSLAVSKGKVIIAIVWHRDVSTDKRRFDSRVLSSLGYRSTNRIDPEVVKKMEEDRMNLSRRLRGAALDEYANQWVDDHFTEKEKLSLGSWVVSRFRKGQGAIPLSVFEEINKVRNETFSNQAELEEWVNSQDWADSVKQEVISKVPNTEKLANDVVLGLDLETGEEAWRFETPGDPVGRGASSTPAVIDGKIYAALSTHLYCVDETNGELVWKTPLKRKGLASSPLVFEGKVYLQQNTLTAFDADSGEFLWENKKVTNSNASPSVWKNVIVCNSSKSLVGVDAETGETIWETTGGGHATPVIQGDYLVSPSSVDGSNLNAYKLTDEGPVALWSKAFVTRRYGSSVIIHDGHVYHLGSARHWCLKLDTGEVAWEMTVQSQLSSPILSDGKILVYENRGGTLSMIQATPEDYTVLGKTKVRALYCASPAIVGNKVIFRTPTSVNCLELK